VSWVRENEFFFFFSFFLSFGKPKKKKGGGERKGKKKGLFLKIFWDRKKTSCYKKSEKKKITGNFSWEL